MSPHRLEIEMGRWARPERIEFDDRKCKLCKKLEDEFHFVLECPLYDDIRKNSLVITTLEDLACLNLLN